MPSIISHGIIGYLLFGIKGLILWILTDITGNIYFSLRTFNDYNTFNPLKVMGHIKHENFTEKDYEISSETIQRGEIELKSLHKNITNIRLEERLKMN